MTSLRGHVIAGLRPPAGKGRVTWRRAAPPVRCQGVAEGKGWKEGTVTRGDVGGRRFEEPTLLAQGPVAGGGGEGDEGYGGG